jgi:serine/threonine-protein kinase RsbW
MSESAKMMLELRNDVAELARLSDGVDAFCSDNALSSRLASSLNLVLEEVVVNVINYAFDDDHPHVILVELQLEGDHVQGQVSDTGAAFDPLSVPSPDLTLDLEQRTVGGLGVHFLRELTDSVSYTRKNGRNYLCFEKKT